MAKNKSMMTVIPVVPALPIAAQATAYRLHLKVPGTEGYLSGCRPMPGAKDAIKAAKGDRTATEPSYSGTGTLYVKLDVVPDPAHPDRFTLTLNGEVVGIGLIDPTYT